MWACQRPATPRPQAVAVPDVRAVRVALHIGELVVLAMIRDPGHDVALDGHLAEDGEGVADTAVRLEGPVREEAVIPDGDSDARQHVADGEDRELGRADHPLPENNDRDHEPDQRQPMIPIRLTTLCVRVMVVSPGPWALPTVFVPRWLEDG